MASALQQIHANAAWVTDNFGKLSGLDPFAFTPESLDYIDGYLDRQAAMVTESPDSINKFVGLFGAYLGECIIAKYGGEWSESDSGLTLAINHGTQCYILSPFQRVYQRISDGMSNSLRYYYDAIAEIIV